MNAFNRIFLLAIAIALMGFTASTSNAQRVRVNSFTPFGLRPDVAIRNGRGNVNVNVNGFGGVNVNAFRVNGFRSNVFFVPQSQAVLVTPQFLSPVNSFGFQSFGVGGCASGFNSFSSFGSFGGFGCNGFCH